MFQVNNNDKKMIKMRIFRSSWIDPILTVWINLNNKSKLKWRDQIIYQKKTTTTCIAAGILTTRTSLLNTYFVIGVGEIDIQIQNKEIYFKECRIFYILNAKKISSFLIAPSSTGHAWRMLQSQEVKHRRRCGMQQTVTPGTSDPAKCYTRNSFPLFGMKSTEHLNEHSQVLSCCCCWPLLGFHDLCAE